MKPSSLFGTALIVLLLSGCGKSGSSSSGAPDSAAAGGVKEVDIAAGDTMKYDVTTIEARPGEALKVVLTNTGSLPKESMGHNWVLLKADADVTGFDTAAAVAKATDYIPPAQSAAILAKIDLLGPHKSGEVSFTAPTVPGNYPFLCTFPAHYLVGMKGFLIVK